MAAKPSATERALKQIEEQVTCGICLEPYTQPKLLNCFHVFCEKCLRPLVLQGQQGQSVNCPHCRQTTTLPPSGVPGLQGAFYIHHLFDIQDTLQKVSSTSQTQCQKCKKREAASYCRSCGFVCQRCKETHQEWEELSSHEIISLSTLAEDVATLVPPLRKTLLCSQHPTKVADLYCDTCDEVICRDCIIRVHRDHHYDLVTDAFHKHKDVIVASLQPVEQQLTTIGKAVEGLDTRCAEVVEQKEAVVTQIDTTIRQLVQALEVRRAELVSEVEHVSQQKLKCLAAQRQQFELMEAKLRSCRDFVQDSLRTGSEAEILAMKKPVVKQMNDLTSSFKPETLAPVERADQKFTHSQAELTKTCQQFGEVYCCPVCPEKCVATGPGSQVAVVGETATVSLQTVDGEGEACETREESVSCEVVSSDGLSQVRATVKRREESKYEISYQPWHRGRHQLHIQVEGKHILNSPFTVLVLPNLTAPTNKTEGLKGPWGIALSEGGDMIVAEHNGHCISIISANGEKKSFGSYGSVPGQFSHPKGVAIDTQGNILVCDYENDRIQKFSPTGKFLQSVGTKGSGPLQFYEPIGIAVHPHTHTVYVADKGNHRIQVLNSDLTYSSSFGKKGTREGELNMPYDISFDSSGRVYVAEHSNHRIQVFSADGQHVQQFGRKGKGDGELDRPSSIAVDSTDGFVYIGEYGNNRVSIFTIKGEFIKSFTQFNGPKLALDKNGTLYVNCTYGKGLQVF